MVAKTKKRQPATIAATLAALTWRQALTAVSILSVLLAAVSPLLETSGVAIPPVATFALLLSIVAVKEIERRLSQRVEADSAPDDTRYIDDLVDEIDTLKRENEALKAAQRDTLPAGYATERAQATGETSDV